MNSNAQQLASTHALELPILIVDDDNFFRSSIVDFLTIKGYKIDQAASAEEAQVLLTKQSYAVVFCDIIMPGMSGTELSGWIKRKHPETIIVMLSGTGRINDAIASIKHGAYDFVQKPLPDIAHIEIILRRALEKRRLDLQNSQLLLQLQNQNVNLELIVNERTEAVHFAYAKLLEKNRELLNRSEKMNNIYLDIITFISDTLEQKDHYTAGHSERVRELALLIAEQLGKNSQQQKTIARAAKLHDVGKIVIDIAFINKEGDLSSAEWEIFKKHPETGAHMLSCLDFLTSEAQLVRHHHERYDGNGYPAGKKRDETPFDGYIIALADAIDAMLSTRSYKQAMSLEQTIIEVKRKSGTQFHPETVAAFLAVAESHSNELMQITNTAHASTTTLQGFPSL